MTDEINARRATKIETSLEADLKAAVSRSKFPSSRQGGFDIEIKPMTAYTQASVFTPQAITESQLKSLTMTLAARYQIQGFGCVIRPAVSARFNGKPHVEYRFRVSGMKGVAKS